MSCGCERASGRTRTWTRVELVVLVMGRSGRHSVGIGGMDPRECVCVVCALFGLRV